MTVYECKIQNAKFKIKDINLNLSLKGEKYQSIPHHASSDWTLGNGNFEFLIDNFEFKKWSSLRFSTPTCLGKF